MNDIISDKEITIVRFLLKSLVVLISLLISGIFIGVLGELSELNFFAKTVTIIILGLTNMIFILHTINLFNRIK